MENSTESENKKLMFLLSEQFGVLSRIDLNSALEADGKTFFFRNGREKFINEKRLIALDMSKQMSHACRMVMWYLSSKITKEEAEKSLFDVLNTEFDHPYSVSAKWNINAMANVLKYSNMHGQLIGENKVNKSI